MPEDVRSAAFSVDRRPLAPRNQDTALRLMSIALGHGEPPKPEALPPLGDAVHALAERGMCLFEGFPQVLQRAVQPLCKVRAPGACPRPCRHRRQLSRRLSQAAYTWHSGLIRHGCVTHGGRAESTWQRASYPPPLLPVRRAQPVVAPVGWQGRSSSNHSLDVSTSAHGGREASPLPPDSAPHTPAESPPAMRFSGPMRGMHGLSPVGGAH